MYCIIRKFGRTNTDDEGVDAGTVQLSTIHIGVGQSILVKLEIWVL